MLVDFLNQPHLDSFWDAPALVDSCSINWIPFFLLSKSQARPPLLRFYENNKQSKNEQGGKECALIVRSRVRKGSAEGLCVHVLILPMDF